MAAPQVVAPAPGPRRAWVSWLDWMWADRRAQFASTFLIVVIVLAVLAPLVTRHGPAEQDVSNIFGAPSWDHFLGTDDLGRDIWSRVVYGARVSLQASLIAVSVGLVIGVPVGLIAGYRGGWVDAVFMRAADTLLAFPGIVLALGVTAALGPGLVNAMTAVGVIFSPSLARITRAQVLATKEHLYVDAAVTFGSSSLRTILRHIIPNAIQPVIAQATFLLGLALLAEASLSYLGVGVQYPEPSWGVMLRRAAEFLSRAPNQVYAPGVAIALTVLAFNALGDSLRDSLDPVTRAKRHPGTRAREQATEALLVSPEARAAPLDRDDPSR